MELKPCPVCGSKPLLFSEDEVMCINRECLVNTVITKKQIWNKRADIINRDKQILQEIKLEHSIHNNEEKMKSSFLEFFE
jgi:hypothetical protein